MLSDRFKKLLKFAWFLPGFLLWAAYPPMGERMDVLFALAPLMWLSRRETDAKVVAKRWFQSGIFFWIATLSWMPAIVKNGGPWPLVVLGWFALAAYCALYFWLYGYFSAKVWRWARGGTYVRRLLSVVLFEPVLWCGLELVRSRLLGGFSWNQLGVVPINSGFGAPAALGGVYLCSAVVILINGTFAGIAERVWKPEESGFQNLKKLGPLETVLAFGVVWGLFGIAGTAGTPETAGTAETTGTTDEGERSIKVAMVQRNFPCCFKAQEENPAKVYDRLLDNVAMLKPDLVVLPESAMCEFGPVDQQGALRFAEWVQKKTGAALLAGGTRFAEGNTYNSATLYSQSPIFNCQSPDQQDSVSNLQLSTSSHQPSTFNLQPSTFNLQPSTFNLQLSTYDKVHLVPFGEFIPGDKLIPALQKLAPVGSCTPGEVKLLDFTPVTDQATEHPVQSDNRTIKQSSNQTISLGCAICFEDTDSAQMRALARQGAKVLFFMTNDSWFSHSIEAEQHAWQAVARAIETGLPVVRVGNSGVTGTIAPDGKTTWLLGPNGRPLVDRAGTMFDRIPISAGTRPQTPYVFWGDCPLAIAFALLIAGLIVVKYKNNL